MLLWRMDDMLIKEARCYRYDLQIIDLFLHILLLTTKMRVSFAEEMFKNYPSIILCDDVLEGFVGKGCGMTKDGVGNDLDRCLGYYDVGLTGFFIEELSQRRDQKVKR